MKTAFEWVKVIGVIVVVILLGEVPAVKELAAFLDAQRAVLLPWTIGLGAAGLIMLVWGMTGVAARVGREMTQKEFEQLSARTQILGPSKQFSKAWFRGQHRGVVVPDTEWRIADLKAAWRDSTWWSNPSMRAKLLTTAGGLLFALGFFGMFVVLIEVPVVKVILLAAVLYALARSTWTVWRV